MRPRRGAAAIHQHSHVASSVIAACLILAVLSAWLAAAGFARLRDPLDRLHCVTFLNVACGGLILVASLLSDGASDRSGKIALLVVLSLLTGAASAHAVGRAVVQRERVRPR